MRAAPEGVAVVSVVALSQCVVAAPCDRDADCGSNAVCVQRTCEVATDRYWNVDVRRAQVGAAHPDGYPWDTDGSPPDLYAEFGLPGDTCLTSYVPDSYAPGWYQSCDFFVPDDPDFTVDLWDVDGPRDELGPTFEWSGAQAWLSLARTADRTTSYLDPSGTATLWLRLSPR